MAQVAAGLKSLGKDITGSDQGVYPPMSDFLQSQGIEIRSPYQAANLGSAEAVVVGNALSRGNPEVEATLDRRIPFFSLPELIHSEILPDKLPIVIAGTHGKTTSTAALAHILNDVGLSPGYMVGGLPIGRKSGFKLGSGRWFVIEGDEYDCAFFDKRPKFLHYQPQIVLLSNIEFDHADIYASKEEIITQFRRLIRLIPSNGCLIINSDWPLLTNLANDAHCPIIKFGRGTNADVRSEFMEIGPDGMKFLIRFSSGREEKCTTSLWGEHQLYNLAGAAAAAELSGVETGKIARALQSFRGVQRRLELKFSDGHRWLYDDFAHHPTAVRAALSSVKARHPGLPVFAAFEPRSNTMVKRYFQDEISEALTLADGVALGEIHRPEKIPSDDRLDVSRVVEYLQEKGRQSFRHSDVNKIVDWFEENIPQDAAVLIMSSGSFSGLVPRLLDRLRAGASSEERTHPVKLAKSAG